MPAKYKRARKIKPEPEWNADSVKALREFLNLTQQELSDQLGVRQQTVSEWEVGLHYPRGASVTVLNMIAERAQFKYGEKPRAGSQSGEAAAPGGASIRYARPRRKRKIQATSAS